MTALPRLFAPALCPGSGVDLSKTKRQSNLKFCTEHIVMNVSSHLKFHQILLTGKLSPSMG